ncbi:MAG: hypothetical protein KC978_02545, partial [Candidatus Omnitrophica bacterium]|nr:hypothetical protein [Candidatus Omnitrophota bacterium]
KAYRRLLEIENEQAASIGESNIEAVAAKIDSKNTLLQDLQKIDKDLHEQHLLWQQVREQAPPELRERLQSQVSALQEAMTQLLELQKTNEEELKKHGDEINRKLKEINRGKSAHKGYQQKAATDAYQKSKFYDQKH